MQPGTMTAVGDMLMAAFPLQHEEMWSTEIDDGPAHRVYCRCGWVAPPADLQAQISRFIDHLMELQNAQ